jgi:hypothetical protein
MLGSRAVFSHCRFIDTRRTQVPPYQVDCKSRAMVFEVFARIKSGMRQRQTVCSGKVLPLRLPLGH